MQREIEKIDITEIGFVQTTRDTNIFIPENAIMEIVNKINEIIEYLNTK